MALATITATPSAGPVPIQKLTVQLTNANVESEPFFAEWADIVWAQQTARAGGTPFTTVQFMYVDESGTSAVIPDEVAMINHPTIGASPQPGYCRMPPRRMAVKASGGSGADRTIDLELFLIRH